jgi:hypothetical protein
MTRAFYTLPEPKEAGLKWREYERARAKVERIDERLQQAKRARAEIEQEIKHLDDSAVRELAQAVLAGEDDPAAKHDEHEKLVARLRDLRREEQAVSQARPVAEEELRQVVYEHQHRWKQEADKALEKAIRDERGAYAKAQELIEKPRAKRLYLEALASWVRYPQPTFSTPADAGVPTAIQNLLSGNFAAEERMRERTHNEQLQEEQQQQEGVA